MSTFFLGEEGAGGGGGGSQTRRLKINSQQTILDNSRKVTALWKIIIPLLSIFCIYKRVILT